MALVIERIDYAPNWREQLYDAGDPAMTKAKDIILEAMKVFIPVSKDGSNGRPAGYARSHLKTLRRGRDAISPFVEVGTDACTPGGASYPAMLEHGTKPHVIRSHGPYPLRDRHGRVFGPVVHHPGTRPIPWARRSAATINGLRL